MSTDRATWITRVGGANPRQAVATYSLKVLNGADAGKEVRVESPRFRLGALEGNGLQLHDPAESGLHVELSHDDAGVRVRDLGSRNGTFIDGVRVADAWLTCWDSAHDRSYYAGTLGLFPSGGVESDCVFSVASFSRL